MSDLFEINEDIQEVNIEESVRESYLDYSMSVIVGRALPDVRDGLKPVHRRILYAMRELNLFNSAKYKKSARIVGDVIGKYHPHGDSAVYEALVRMAQDFSMRIPLIDGQGNFGSIDGDSAAAMRYTEAKMSAMAEEILKDIDKDTVDFTSNYDDTMREPDVLPSRIPNLLLNGSSGIAVGMATNIPTHNLRELIDGLTLLIDDKDADNSKLLSLIKGPDFPTGGIIFGKKGIIEGYESGRGRIRVRAKTHIETKGNRDVIVIDELPYQVNKARLVEQIATLAKDKQIEGISEVRDESDRDGIRVVIELKKEAMSEIVLNHLFKSTSLETTFGINLLAIHNKEPKLFSLKEILTIFLNHRKSVIIRRTIFELEKARARAHILEGLKIALSNIDKIVALIRNSSDSAVAKESLIVEFSLSEIQAKSILEMRLSRLTSLEGNKIDEEYNGLLIAIDGYELILKSEVRLNEIIKEELLEIRESYKSERKTEIVDDYDDIDYEDLIPNEPNVVTITHRGYIKRVPLKQYEKQKRGGKGKTALTIYDDDFIESFFVADTHDTLMFVSNLGQLYWLKVYKIPEASRSAKGKAVVNLIELEAEEKIQSIITTKDFADDKSLIFFTKNGVIKRTNLSEYSNIRKGGVRAIVLDEGDELTNADIAINDMKEVMVLSSNGMSIRFPLEDVRPIGRSTRGVSAIKLKSDDFVVGGILFSNGTQELLIVSQGGIGKRTELDEYRAQSRAGSGVISMKINKKTGSVVGGVIVDESKDLMALTSSGKMIRVDMQTIRKAGRNTMGVKIITVDDEKVISIAVCPKSEELEDDEDEGVEVSALINE